jgi:capsular exopolysaccharide synthesis family protein
MRRAAARSLDASVETLERPVGQVDEFPSEAADPATAADLIVRSRTLPEQSGVEEAGDSADGESSPARKSLLDHVDARLSTKTVVDAAMIPASREQYRRLAATLHQAQRTSGCKVVMVASAVAGEGKTLTATNLALTLSESYRRNVLLIDGDLRLPSLHKVFQIGGSPGLSDGLVTGDDPKLPLHRLSPRLAVLPAGEPTSDPIGVLTSDRMRLLIDEAREVFDWVLIDTPPVGMLTDAALLASMTDGVALVVKAESTSYDLVNRAIEILGRERVIGVVLNRAREMPHRTSYDYSKYYYGASATTADKA